MSDQHIDEDALRDSYAEDESNYQLTNEGKLCPKCYGKNIKYVGNATDGMRLNAFYDCQDCNFKWEGF